MGSEPDPRYLEAWADYRRRNRSGCLACGAVALLPPLAVVLLICNAGSEGADPPFGMFFYVPHLALALGVAVPLGIVANLVVVARRMREFRCPRCGARFVRRLADGTHCQHCGLPRGAKRDPDADRD